MQRALRELNTIEQPSPADFIALDALDAEYVSSSRHDAKAMAENAPKFKRLVRNAGSKSARPRPCALRRLFSEQERRRGVTVFDVSHPLSVAPRPNTGPRRRRRERRGSSEQPVALERVGDRPGGERQRRIAASRLVQAQAARSVRGRPRRRPLRHRPGRRRARASRECEAALPPASWFPTSERACLCNPGLRAAEPAPESGAARLKLSGKKAPAGSAAVPAPPAAPAADASRSAEPSGSTAAPATAPAPSLPARAALAAAADDDDWESTSSEGGEASGGEGEGDSGDETYHSAVRGLRRRRLSGSPLSPIQGIRA